MPFEVDTKDTTALGDSELGEMADIGESGDAGIDLGFLSKEREEWVLVTQVRDKGKLQAFSFSTLERIGGTPCILLGVASVRRVSRRDSLLRSLMAEQYRRAVLAFPDEDVLVGTRLIDPGGYDAFRGLKDVVPRSDHKASGEERAWGRRLAKRFGADGKLDDRTFALASSGPRQWGGLDYTSPKPEKPAESFGQFFSGIDPAKGERLVAFGWAMAEDLANGKLTR
jgi:hypothetical protein